MHGNGLSGLLPPKPCRPALVTVLREQGMALSARAYIPTQAVGRFPS